MDFSFCTKNIKSNLDALHNQGDMHIKKCLLNHKDERISRFSYIEAFKEHRTFITHDVTQNCLDRVFYSIESFEKKSLINIIKVLFNI